MLSINECKQILGEERVLSITSKFQQKEINQETINRVLDYLALNKKAFPYLDNIELENNLINNLHQDIVHEDFIVTLSRNIKDNLNPLKPKKILAAYANGRNVIVANQAANSLSDPLANFFKPKKYIEQCVDSAIRHELGHIASTKIIEIENDHQLKSLFEENLKQIQNLFNPELPGSPEEVVDASFRNFIQKKGRGLKWFPKTGISGKPTSLSFMGSEPVDEGAIQIKTKILDGYANPDGFSPPSGYDEFQVKIAQHMIDTIGAEQFFKMHQKGDFAGITKEYANKTGKSLSSMLIYYKDLERRSTQHKNKIKSIIPNVISSIEKSFKDLYKKINPNIKTKEEMQEFY